MTVTPLRFTQPPTRPPWQALYQTNQHGTPLPNLHNVLVALRTAPEWTNRLRYDEMLATVTIDGSPAEDIHIFRAHEWMQANGLQRVGLDPIREAIEIVGRQSPHHPLRDWLNNLAWDNTPRLDHWLTNFLGAEDTSATQKFGRFFLLSMVARIFRPGCQVDQMLVLEGPQGALKSQFCRALGGEYFSDALPELTTDYVRVCMHLRGKWLIEVAELHAFSRAETTRLKSFITQQIEEFTPKFGRHETREPRQCVFIGTTNKNTYLRDETGGRRFWPVKCGIICLEAFVQARPQLFAEAVAAFRAGEPWYPDPAFWREHIEPLQRDRHVGDSWEANIADWDFTDAARDSNGKPIYDSDASGNRTPAPRLLVKGPPFTLAAIARGALNIEKLSKAEEMRLAAILDHMGWIRATRTTRGIPWNPPNVDSVAYAACVASGADPDLGF